MKLSSALVDIALELVTQKDRNGKQLETERAKQQKQRGGNERLEVLIAMRDQVWDFSCIYVYHFVLLDSRKD